MLNLSQLKQTARRKERTVFIILLSVTLLLVWLLYDVLLVKKELFVKIEEFSFENKTPVQIKEKIGSEIKRYQSATDATQQVTALVNLLECHYFEVYRKRKGMKQYYDFIKIILYPSQRVQLKSKPLYIQQARRFLKRKKNLHFRLLKYEVSKPRFSGVDPEVIVSVLVVRTQLTDTGNTLEQFKYNFRKHTDNRYYLYFNDKSSMLRFKLVNAGSDAMSEQSDRGNGLNNPPVQNEHKMQ